MIRVRSIQLTGEINPQRYAFPGLVKVLGLSSVPGGLVKLVFEETDTPRFYPELPADSLLSPAYQTIMAVLILKDDEYIPSGFNYVGTFTHYTGTLRHVYYRS